MVPASLVAWRSASLKYAGTVMTASVTGSPRYASASRLSLPRMRALISCAVYFLSSIVVVQSVPMWRLTDEMVRSTLVTAWRLATSPTSTSPVLENATTDGVVRDPLRVRDDRGLAALEGGDHGVGGAEVDADCSCHVRAFLPEPRGLLLRGVLDVLSPPGSSLRRRRVVRQVEAGEVESAGLNLDALVVVPARSDPGTKAAASSAAARWPASWAATT